jgi:hypothetical protein
MERISPCACRAVELAKIRPKTAASMEDLSSRVEACFPPTRRGSVGAPIVQEFWLKYSRYKDGTMWPCSLAFPPVLYRAFESDRCLVIPTGSNRVSPFHGGNTGSNPVGDANLFSGVNGLGLEKASVNMTNS